MNRDSLAEWYAERHVEIDPGVEQVIHLPANAPPREIRLLEVNTLISEVTPPEPVDFGVDIDGAEGHTLYVLDVTPNQWDAIQNGTLELPTGWSLAEKRKLLQRKIPA